MRIVQRALPGLFRALESFTNQMSSLKTMDDDRINALFATITKQEDGSYTQNMLDKLQFWKKEIETLLSQSKGSKLILNTLNLQSRFEINGLTPLCLDEVLVWNLLR